MHGCDHDTDVGRKEPRQAFSSPLPGHQGTPHLARLLSDALAGEWDAREMCGLMEHLYKAASPAQLIELGEELPWIFRDGERFESLLARSNRDGT